MNRRKFVLASLFAAAASGVRSVLGGVRNDTKEPPTKQVPYGPSGPVEDWGFNRPMPDGVSTWKLDSANKAELIEWDDIRKGDRILSLTVVNGGLQQLMIARAESDPGKSEAAPIQYKTPYEAYVSDLGDPDLQAQINARIQN